MVPQTDWLETRTQARPQGLALSIGERSYTYTQLNQLTNHLTTWLTADVAPTNGRVAVLMPNDLTYVCTIYALARLGWVLVPLNTRLTPSELAWQLAETECDTVLYGEETAVLIAQLQPKRPHSQTVLVPEPSALPTPPHPIAAQPWPLDKTQAILFTSGTSGRPKAVPLTFGNHFYSAMGSAYRLGVVPNDLWLSCLPLYHVGGLAVIFRSCLYGTAIDLHSRFTLDGVNHSLDTKPITLASFVPTIMFRLLESREHWPETMRIALIGGAAASPELVTAAQAQGVPLATTYGLTEASSQVATLLSDGVAHKPASVGRPLMFTQIKIINDQGGDCPAGELGEIAVSGLSLMSGYLNNPEANAERFVDGYFRTGDIGYLDEDGDLWLVQRRSDLIVSGGENVYPAEVEAQLRQHPAVKEACVVGLPDPEWGEQVAAMVQLNRGMSLTTDDLIAYTSSHLARYKQPRVVQFVTELPQTASGKIARKQAAEQLAKLKAK